MNNTKRALVTGATGFIGRRLVRTLRERGQEVTCLVRSTSRREELEPLGVRFAVGDMNDVDSLEAAAVDADVVYHLAAMLRVPWRRSFISANAQGVENMAEACVRQPAPPVFVLVSSLAAGGVRSNGVARDEEDVPAPVSRYGRAKLGGEVAAAAYADRMPVTIVRPPMVLGEGDRLSLPLFKMATRGYVVSPTLKPQQLSLIHVDDLAELLIAAAERGERLPPPGETPPSGEQLTGQGIYYAAADEAPTLPELGGRIAAALGRKRPRAVCIPSAVTWGLAGVGEAWGRLRDRPTWLNLDKVREATAGAWHCSATKANDGLGFRHAPLEERLAATASWYQERAWL